MSDQQQKQHLKVSSRHLIVVKTFGNTGNVPFDEYGDKVYVNCYFIWYNKLIP